MSYYAQKKDKIMKKKVFKKIIKGERITLRKLPCSMEHAEFTLSIVNRNRNYLLPWGQWVHYAKTAKDYFEWLEQREKDWDNKRTASYGIHLGKEFIGRIAIEDINYIKDTAECGYWIDSKHAGKGYATEALKVIEKEYFERGLNRIVIYTDPDNLASIRVAEKNNYVLEGIMRQDDYYLDGDGEYRNTAIYSKLYHEWEYENG
jgi:RimJ/RimL family protein N-acetyltransferase